MSKRIIVIAGPNGAGKTTFARAFLPREAQCPRFINADLIAAGLSPFAPEVAAVRAGRLMLAEIAVCGSRRKLRFRDHPGRAGISAARRCVGAGRQYGFRTRPHRVGRKPMKPQDINQAKSAELRGSLPAMKRAAQRARETAIQTNTDLIVVRDGHTVRISAETLRHQTKSHRDPAR